MNVAGISKFELVLGNIGALSIGEDPSITGIKAYAISSYFWKTRAEQALVQLLDRLREGADLTGALAETLADTAANITLVVETGLDLILATGWCGHGLYWSRQQSGRLVFSDEECLLAATSSFVMLRKTSVIRYLHDDANISPLNSLFEGISRIPGGCLARFGPDGVGQELRPLPLTAEPAATAPLPRRLADALDKTAAEIVEQANGGLIYAQVSGGLDGLAIMASLIRKGGRVLAIYGDDGDDQHAINEQVVDALKRRFPDAELTYRRVRRGAIAEPTLEHQQQARCTHLIKGNYLKRNYKLALADAGAEQSEEQAVCVVNGYGIDELYSGAKGDASLSTIHPLNAPLALARVISGWRTSRPGLLWLLWRLRLRKLTGSRIANHALLSRHLIWAGKAGGSLGLSAAGQITDRFNEALTRDGEALGRLLSPLLPKKPSLDLLTAFCKRFIYSLVEQTHLVRFAGHGYAAGLTYILPYEAGRIRSTLEQYSPTLSEICNPKQGLRSYLLEMDVDYEAITRAVTRQRSVRRKQLQVVSAKSKASLKRALGPLVRVVRRSPPPGSDPSLNRALQQVGRQHPNQHEGFRSLLEELRRISGASYVDGLEEAIRTGMAHTGAFSTKQVYNYAHLVRYVLAARERAGPC